MIAHVDATCQMERSTGIVAPFLRQTLVRHETPRDKNRLTLRGASRASSALREQARVTGALTMADGLAGQRIRIGFQRLRHIGPRSGVGSAPLGRRLTRLTRSRFDASSPEFSNLDASSPGGEEQTTGRMMSGSFRYFRGSVVFTIAGLIAASGVGYYYTGSVAGALRSAFIVGVLSVLEVSLSFDNAVVNAKVLVGMPPIWRQRFITWGIAIAVFGMRIVFPLVIVSVIGKIGPIDAVELAATNPVEYERILTSAHISLSAFGGAFLAMVGLKHFLDAEKKVHWIAVIEKPLAALGRVDAVQIGVVLLLLYGVSTRLPEHENMVFLVAGLFGLLTYIAVDGIGAFLDPDSAAGGAGETAARAGLASFLYLEVLDASFSFDGVIGAFALSNNLFIIAIGLGTGAMFVRSLTIMLVDKGTLTEYLYLEHGAFYAIISLAVIMFLKTFMEVPELVTGMLGAGFIGVALLSSLRYNAAHKDDLQNETAES